MATANIELLTVQEAAQLFEVDVRTIHRWINAGLLRSIVLPHKGSYKIHRVEASTVRRILARREGKKAR